MFKSRILLGLAFAFGAVSAAENDTVRAASEADLGINFFTAWYNEGAITTCTEVKFDQCYTFTDNIIAGGLSSARFDNYSMWAKSFTFELYSGTACNDRYDKWSFLHGFHDPPRDIIAFPTLNDNVRSFKVINAYAGRYMSWSGISVSPPQHTLLSSCWVWE